MSPDTVRCWVWWSKLKGIWNNSNYDLHSNAKLRLFFQLEM